MSVRGLSKVVQGLLGPYIRSKMRIRAGLKTGLAAGSLQSETCPGMGLGARSKVKLEL